MGRGLIRPSPLRGLTESSTYSHLRKVEKGGKRLEMAQNEPLRRPKAFNHSFYSPKFFLLGGQHFYAVSPLCGGWPNQPPSGTYVPQKFFRGKSKFDPLIVVRSNYNLAHRDQRPQISRNTCLTRFFWIFPRKFCFAYPNRLKKIFFRKKIFLVLESLDQLQTITIFCRFFDARKKFSSPSSLEVTDTPKSRFQRG